MNAVVTIIVAMIANTHYNELTMVFTLRSDYMGMDTGFSFYHCINT